MELYLGNRREFGGRSHLVERVAVSPGEYRGIDEKADRGIQKELIRLCD